MAAKESMMITVDAKMPQLARYEEYLPEDVVRIVATEGGNNDWAAYIETPYARKQINPPLRPAKESIRAYGQKLTSEEAIPLFPSFNADLTWRD